MYVRLGVYKKKKKKKSATSMDKYLHEYLSLCVSFSFVKASLHITHNIIIDL